MNADVLSWGQAYFGEGTGRPILMDNVACSGNEPNLVSCPFSTPSSSDTHSDDAGVTCFPINGSPVGMCNSNDNHL